MVKVYETPEVGFPKGQFKHPMKLDMILDCSKHPVADSVEVVPDDNNEFIDALKDL